MAGIIGSVLRRYYCWALLGFSGVIVLVPACYSQEFPTSGLVESWGNAISSDLLNRLNSGTGIEFLRQKYRDKNFQETHIDGSKLVKEVSEKWQEMLAKKMVAVKNIVDVLEEAFANHTQNESISYEDVKFPNAKNISNMTLTYLENFRADVNTNYSAVQIPTDIWEGDKTILNGIEATNPIDKAFRDNYAVDPQLLWQYFGSADGFYRSFPAAAWVAEDPSKDQYDVRRRGWWIQAASSPKTVMILIDTSGSTYGMTLEIMKVSVSKALDTLGNDDFVNVAYFNSDVSAVSCFDTFVQANLRNKETLKGAVQNLTATRIADFHKALEYAFNQFEIFNLKDKPNNQGADCHQAILIFTDGGEDNEKEVFADKNYPVKTRVFVYNVGSDSMVSPAGVKDMACNNKGFFSSIKSFGAVRLTTLDYVPVLSRPMVLSNQKHFQWSDIYLDALGLGMMTTLTRPVYNKTQPREGEDANQQMLGVVGTDITTKNMEETVPKNKIGPEGYAFGINSNGYILLHPRLKAELGYLSEPPNVDFLEVEFITEEKKQLRKNMINTLTDQQVLLTPVMSRDERYVAYVNMSYSYTNIKSTTFSVAIAQPSFGLYEYNISTGGGVDMPNGLGYFKGTENSNDFVLIAPWEFCEGIQEENASTETIANKLQEVIDIATKELKDDVLTVCDDYMVKKLFVDAQITKDLLNDWIRTWKDVSKSGILYQMVATQGGLTRIHPETVPRSWPEEKIKSIQDPWDQSYYQRALYTNEYVLSVPYNSGNKRRGFNMTYLTEITASKAMKMNREITPAVLAVVFDPKVFNEAWIGHTRMGFNKKESPMSCDDPSLFCYILDDGGFMVATNRDELQEQVGNFFGIIDGDIMHELNRSAFYQLKKTIDWQAACPRQQQTGDAAPRSIYIPTIGDIFNFNTMAVSAVWSFIRHLLYDMFVYGFTDHGMVGAEDVEVPENVSCIKQQKQYYFGENYTITDGNMECSNNCSRSWAATLLGGTNLALVVSNKDCAACPNRILVQEPTEPPPEEVPNPCEAEILYRKRPLTKCYRFDANESSVCSSSSSLHSSLLALVFHSFYIVLAVFITQTV